MATYIALSNFTDQGIRTVKETTQRAEAVREAADKFGVKVKDIFWTLGQYDLVVIFEASDDAVAPAFGLSLGVAGNVRTQTLRAYSEEEMNVILSMVLATTWYCSKCIRLQRKPGYQTINPKLLCVSEAEFEQ